MKLIVAGPRNLLLREGAVGRALFVKALEPEEIIEGGANGVDCAAGRFAQLNGVPHKMFAADWTKYGKAAGPIRNREMAEYADALLVIKERERDTAGTSSMMKLAENRGLPIHVYNVRPGDVYGGAA